MAQANGAVARYIVMRRTQSQDPRLPELYTEMQRGLAALAAAIEREISL